TILNRDDDPRVALEVLWLLAPFRRVEQCLIALDVHPDHRHLRSPIRVERDDVTVRLVLQHFLYRLRQRDGHDAPPGSGFGCGFFSGWPMAGPTHCSCRLPPSPLALEPSRRAREPARGRPPRPFAL